ncbi:MAG: hypothetical protein H6Q91_1436, partial [Deltaproteobacteria bacterium]|nr:hypothetical protein [Deltaproteobacteria bacterium]
MPAGEEEDRDLESRDPREEVDVQPVRQQHLEALLEATRVVQPRLQRVLAAKYGGGQHRAR